MVGVSDGSFPFLPRFASPSESVLRARIEEAGEKYGFRLASLRILHPFQAAPVVVVQTERDRDAFVGDVAAIVQALNPWATAGGDRGPSYEGFVFEARDVDGAFVRSTRTAGSRWAASGRRIRACTRIRTPP